MRIHWTDTSSDISSVHCVWLQSLKELKAKLCTVIFILWTDIDADRRGVHCVWLQNLTELKAKLCTVIFTLWTDIDIDRNIVLCVWLQNLTELKVKLREVDRRIPLPPEAINTVWEHCICLVNRTFVEGSGIIQSYTSVSHRLNIVRVTMTLGGCVSILKGHFEGSFSSSHCSCLVTGQPVQSPNYDLFFL